MRRFFVTYIIIFSFCVLDDAVISAYERHICGNCDERMAGTLGIRHVLKRKKYDTERIMIGHVLNEEIARRISALNFVNGEDINDPIYHPERERIQLLGRLSLSPNINSFVISYRYKYENGSTFKTIFLLNCKEDRIISYLTLSEQYWFSPVNHRHMYSVKEGDTFLLYDKYVLIEVDYDVLPESELPKRTLFQKVRGLIIGLRTNLKSRLGLDAEYERVGSFRVQEDGTIDALFDD